MSTPRTDRLACIDWFRRGDLEEIFTELRALETELQQAQAALAAMTNERDVFRKAQKICEDCDAPTVAEVAELRAALAAVTLEREQEKAHLTAKLDEVVAEKRDVVELRRSLDDRNGLIHEMRSMLRLAGFPERVKSGEDEYGNEYFIPVRVEVQLKDALAQLAACQSREAKALEQPAYGPVKIQRICYCCIKCGLVAAYEEQPCPLCASRTDLQQVQAKALEELKASNDCHFIASRSADNHERQRKAAEKKLKQAESDRDQLQAQVGALRGVMEGIKEPVKEALRLMRREGWEHMQKPETTSAFNELFDAWSNLSAALARDSVPAPAAPDSAKDGVADYLGTVPTEPAKDGQ